MSEEVAGAIANNGGVRAHDDDDQDDDDDEDDGGGGGEGGGEGGGGCVAQSRRVSPSLPLVRLGLIYPRARWPISAAIFSGVESCADVA